MKEFRVSSKSVPSSLAGAIHMVLSDGDTATLSCIGAGAVNQALKACAIANERLGGTLVFIPCFEDAERDGEKISMIKILCKKG